MAGSAEVKAALAFARTMRRPAGSLLAFLDRLDRLAADVHALPDFMVTDPATALDALLAAPPAAADEQTGGRARGGLTGVSARPASVRPVPQPAAPLARPATAPAGVVEAARAGADRAQPAPATPRQRLRPADVRTLRDKVRRGEALPTPAGRAGADSADAPAMRAGAASPALPAPRDRAGAAMADATRVPATARHAAPLTPTQARRFRPPAATAVPPTQAQAGDIGDGAPPPHARAGLDAVTYGSPPAGGANSLPEATESAARTDTALPGQITAPSAADTAPQPAATPARRPLIPAPIAPPRAAIDPAASRGARLRLDDAGTDLTEATWRAGIDLP